MVIGDAPICMHLLNNAAVAPMSSKSANWRVALA
jgi:hypothetical protein